MMGLSLPRRLALLATALAAFAQVSSASAQVPVFTPPEPVPAPETAPATEPAAPETAPTQAPAVPPAPPRAPGGAPPVGAATPAPDRTSTHPPAKTDHIAGQRAMDDPGAYSEVEDAEYAGAGEPRRRW